MLRISVMNETGITRMKLEGKLANEWVREARDVWETVSEMSSGEIIVDLLDVSFVDDAGHQLLADMRHVGAELIGSGPLITALIDEIEEAEAAATQDATDGD
jgi:anti-anti-sigma regulatory factor